MKPGGEENLLTLWLIMNSMKALEVSFQIYNIYVINKNIL